MIDSQNNRVVSTLSLMITIVGMSIFTGCGGGGGGGNLGISGGPANGSYVNNGQSLFTVTGSAAQQPYTVSETPSSQGTTSVDQLKASLLRGETIHYTIANSGGTGIVSVSRSDGPFQFKGSTLNQVYFTATLTNNGTDYSRVIFETTDPMNGRTLNFCDPVTGIHSYSVAIPSKIDDPTLIGITLGDTVWNHLTQYPGVTKASDLLSVEYAIGKPLVDLILT